MQQVLDLNALPVKAVIFSRIRLTPVGNSSLRDQGLRLTRPQSLVLLPRTAHSAQGGGPAPSPDGESSGPTRCPWLHLTARALPWPSAALSVRFPCAWAPLGSAASSSQNFQPLPHELWTDGGGSSGSLPPSCSHHGSVRVGSTALQTAGSG